MDHSSPDAPVIREEIHWPALIAAVASITAVGIAIGLGCRCLSVILEKRGISSSMIGLNSAMAGVAAMAAARFRPWIARRLTVVTTMVLAIVAAAASALGFYFAEALWMWFPLRIVFHGAITILFVLSEFWINTAAPPSRRGLVLGIYATVLSLGFAAGPLIFSIVGSEGILPFASAPESFCWRPSRSSWRARKIRSSARRQTSVHALCVPGAHRNGGGVCLRRGRIRRAVAVPDLCQPDRLYRITGRAAADHDRTGKRSVPDSDRPDCRPNRGPAAGCCRCLPLSDLSARWPCPS
jgi:hypothetical protein